MSHTKGRGAQVVGIVSHFIDCAIHQRTNQCEVFGILFNADKGLLTCHIPAWTNIDNVGGSDDNV